MNQSEINKRHEQDIHSWIRGQSGQPADIYEFIREQSGQPADVYEWIETQNQADKKGGKTDEKTN